MASISGSTSSLSNTLKGYGGMASGIDRDSIIEQMTLGTTTKINNVKKDKTELQWKQEAYQSLSDKIIDLQDNYMTYSSDSNLKSSSVFSANQITAIGDEDATKYISASGTSAMLDSLSILGVKQTASAATVLSGVKSGNAAITTSISDLDSNTAVFNSSLKGTKLEFGNYQYAGNNKGSFNTKSTFTFVSSYTKKNADGKDETITIDYTTQDTEKLAAQLNEYIKESGFKLEDGVTIQFGVTDGKLSINCVKKELGDGTVTDTAATSSYVIDANSTALEALGFSTDGLTEQELEGIKTGISFSGADAGEFNNNIKETLYEASVNNPTMKEYLVGKSLTVTYGGQSASIELITEKEKDSINSLEDLKTAVQNRLNKAFGVGKVQAEIDQDGCLVFKTGNKTTVTASATDSGVTVNYGGVSETIAMPTEEELTEYEQFKMDTIASALAEQIGGSVSVEKSGENYNINISYNGISLTLQNPSGGTIALPGKTVSIGNALQAGEDAALQACMQDKLDAVFGEGNVTASVTNGSYSIETESFDTLTVNASDAAVRKNLGLTENESNRISTSGTLWDNKEALGFSSEMTEEQFNEALKDFSINGESIEGITKDTTVSQLLSKINKSDAGVKASYLSGTGQFVLVADQTGTGREINLGGSAATIFGGKSSDGRDAVMAVSYGNGVVTTMTSSTNTFNLEGVKVNVSGAFGYVGTRDEAAEVSNEQWLAGLDSAMEVTFEAKADAEGVTEQVKKFIEEYNALVEEIYSHSTTRPDRDYGALTDEQKKEMSEKEIENWENKAKQGLLFGDSNVRNLYSDLQNIVSKLMSSGVSYKDLESIGITTSDSKADYGKLIFDESKFKKAMETDPELVSNIFTGGGDVKKGLVQTIEDTLTPYATRYSSSNNGSYGFLIEEAGSEKLILSTTDNYIYTQLKEMDEQIKTLQSRLKSEQDRYIKQFTTMETMISQMNTQSGYLSQFSA